MDAAEGGFGEVVDRYGKSDHADMARLYLARSISHEGKRSRRGPCSRT